jgi:hypothetical protein
LAAQQRVIPASKVASRGLSGVEERKLVLILVSAIGHPFGATDIRLLISCCGRLKRENGGLGIVASCAAGGLGQAMLIERLS